MTGVVELAYRVTSPEGVSFTAKIVDRDGSAAVISDRGGDWATEPVLTVADLIMPEQKFIEWDIVEVDSGLLVVDPGEGP